MCVRAIHYIEWRVRCAENMWPYRISFYFFSFPLTATNDVYACAVYNNWTMNACTKFSMHFHQNSFHSFIHSLLGVHFIHNHLSAIQFKCVALQCNYIHHVWRFIMLATITSHIIIILPFCRRLIHCDCKCVFVFCSLHFTRYIRYNTQLFSPYCILICAWCMCFKCSMLENT